MTQPKHDVFWDYSTGFALVYHEDPTPKQKRICYSFSQIGGKSEGVQIGGKCDGAKERSLLRQSLSEFRRHSQTPPTIYVLGRQGNSKDIMFWQWSEMVDSSRQLKGVKDWVKSPEYVLPPEGLTEELSGKFVRVPLPHYVTAFQAGSHYCTPQPRT